MTEPTSEPTRPIALAVGPTDIVDMCARLRGQDAMPNRAEVADFITALDAMWRLRWESRYNAQIALESRVLDLNRQLHDTTADRVTWQTRWEATDKALGDALANATALSDALKPFADCWTEFVRDGAPNPKHPQHYDVVIATDYFRAAHDAITRVSGGN